MVLACCYLYLNNVSLLHCLQTIDKQSLLDSGILSCLVHILNALLLSDGENVRQNVVTVEEEANVTENVAPERRLEVGHLLLFILNPGIFWLMELHQMFVGNPELYYFSRKHYIVMWWHICLCLISWGDKLAFTNILLYIRIYQVL